MFQSNPNIRALVATTLLLLSYPVLATAQPCSDPSATACWPGDGNALDVVGTAHGTLHGDATFAPGKVGQAFSFDGSGDWVSFGIGSETALDFSSGDFTLGLWVNFNTLGGEQVIIEKFTGSNTPGWTLTKLSNNSLLFWGCGGTGCIAHPSGFTAGTWHHVAITRSGNTYTLFVDGVSLVSAANGNAIPPSTNPLIIGRRNAADGRGFFVNGMIDEIQILTSALSGQDIADIVIAADNNPPTADAGGPYAGDEGTSIALTGASASDPDSDPLTYGWSVDDPGLCSFSDDSVPAPDLTCADNGTFTVTLTVDDGIAESVSSDATVTVDNVAPTITDVVVPSSPIIITDLSGFSVSADFSDPAGVNDEEYTCDFDFDNDGVTDETVTGVTGTSCSANLNYDVVGVYTVKVTVTDKDGGNGPAEAVTSIVIYDPIDPTEICTHPAATACWPANGNALDAAGTTHGTLHGDATYSPGKVGQAFNLDGNGDWVSFGDGSETALDFSTGDFTLDFWVKFNSLAGEQVMMEKFTGQSTPGWTLTKLSNDFLLLSGCGGAANCIQRPSGFSAGTWHHVAVTRNGSTYALYVDGVALGSEINSSPIPPSSDPLLAGRRNQADGRGFYVNGLIDEIHVLAVALSSEGIEAIVEASANTPPTANAGGPYSGNEASSIALSAATASDLEGDPLTFSWSVDNPGLCSFSDDATLSPDLTCADNGSFTVTLTADDGTNDPVSSDATVTVNNVAPTVVNIIVPSDPVNIDDQASSSIDLAFSDPAGANDEDYTCGFDFDNDGTVDETASGVTGTTCGATLDYEDAGVYTVKVTVTDKDGGAGAGNAVAFVVIYDPSDGFVTGGGWIDSPAGACPDFCEDATGKASFGFVSKYKKGASVPTGQTQFQFKAGDLNFHSSSYDWLVIAGAKAMYKGNGTINGSGDYSFQINAIDGDVSGGGDVDRFRIKIKEAGGGVIYDNQPGAGANDDPSTALGGGSIKIHQNGAGKQMAAAATEESTNVPAVFALHQNYPNPFNPSTVIQFDLPEAVHVRAVIYDVTGREVARLVDQEMPAGRHRVNWDGGQLPSGTYLYHLTAGEFTETRTMVLLR